MKKFSNTKALRELDITTKEALAWEYANLQPNEMLAVIVDTDYGYSRVVKTLVSYFTSSQNEYNLDLTEQVVYLAKK